MSFEQLSLVIASANPVKIEAAREAFEAVFNCAVEVTSAKVASEVADQPMSYEETRLGALNRVENAQQQYEADYFIAFEGGVDVFEDGPKTFACICIANAGDTVFGQTATLPLPLSIYQELLLGKELGHAMDDLFNTENIKQKGGAIGQLTNGVETRKSIYKSAAILALSRFLHAQLF